jgi:hypothetical protein
MKSNSNASHVRTQEGSSITLQEGRLRLSWTAHLSWTRVPGGKGASLFYMIPLERWNVERKSLPAVKEKYTCGSHPLLAHLRGRWITDKNCTFHRCPKCLERTLQLDTPSSLALAHTGGHTCWAVVD